MEKELHAKLAKIENKYKWLLFTFVLFTSILLLSFILLFVYSQTTEFGIIRAKGIIIEDDSGRDRILIGAPIPDSKNRIRTDTAKVREHWSKKYEDQDQFMSWYSDYLHSTDGIVIMNEKGFDRVLIGDKLADPNSGKRLFEAAGMTWNDKEGWEMGGAGVNTSADGKARSMIGLDDSEGEAVHLVALEDGTKALIIGGANGRLMIGMSDKNGQWFQNEQEFIGVKFFDDEGKVVWEQKMNVDQTP
ncbi:MAG: hypothetical protein JJU28_17885 [Cyclobacteriaceae bacterium]|nr:hypothetical protein [Cyclobacteriaceae bacterium]